MHVYRRIGIGTVAALWMGAVVGCGGGQRPVAKPFSGPVIAISDSLLRAGVSDTLQFGSLYSGETARREVAFCNRGTVPIVILRSEVSCGCTRLEFDSQPIMPGDTARVTLLFDSSGQHGWVFKRLRVYFSTAVEPLRIYVEAEVR